MLKGEIEMKKVLKRLKNKKVLLAIASAILLILVNVGVIDVAMSDNILATVNTILGIGVSVGVLGNPDSHIEN
jgi:uncharacterized membrane protein